MNATHEFILDLEQGSKKKKNLKNLGVNTISNYQSYLQLQLFMLQKNKKKGEKHYKKLFSIFLLYYMHP